MPLHEVRHPTSCRRWREAAIGQFKTFDTRSRFVDNSQPKTDPGGSGMHVRKFQVGDEAALFRVYYSAIHQIACRDYSPSQIEAWAPADLDNSIWEKRIRGINPFVIEADGALIGYADLQENGYIDHFFVSGDHPRQGVGRLLMETIHDYAQRQSMKVLTSDVSRTAQPFFEHFGFEVLEQRSPTIRGVVVPNALMRKTFAAR
ncbi:GNAT family N-acetyltransferase [Burkholderia thailandensis]|nr:GNAT family N-acetyltransferase [Burkholderia thailandensis]MCS3399562.1 GNAT family N-acetyltransferase [Burkholderia thailandensis]